MENPFSLPCCIVYREFLSSRPIKGGYIFVPRRGFLLKKEDKKDLPWGFNNVLTH
jgi:hypothetical protein